jgi:N-acyl-D-amino-acid deacylase
VGELVPSTGDNVIDATGLTLAPGFIDTHSHADGDVFELPDALAAVSQGSTTVVVGQDVTSGKRSTRRYRSGGRPAFRSKSRT